ncbi:hypothetical protein AJ80_08598 [Polytolypa hystricis UAMH7299]|uniref:Hemerythrin-like domain-containing protein n=1 Tax=Polytolypa hystricis (strain UAMH7299) TaxID=1447883 RepID=A0A2B7WXA8_POLH7|nr:hypothetical protein AJ80_08598 [Polytolypa hystricis UAMH7299]
MENSKPWADRPFELVPSPKFKGFTDDRHWTANEMAVSHNIYIRGINAIYLQAEHVSEPQDIRDFILFCRIWIEILDHHHQVEEKIFFPMMEELTGVKGLMAPNVEQHHAFHDGLAAFTEYISSATPETYDGKALKKHVDSFAAALVQHLHDEIPTLMELHEHDRDGSISKKAYIAFENELVSQSGKTRHRPFILGLRDVSFEEGANASWPPGVPFFIPYALSALFSKTSGVWRFLPSDFHGRKRPLAFVSG